jgi:hypothetical protein
VTEKYEFIDGEAGTYPVQRMCAWAGVSTSGFYHLVRALMRELGLVPCQPRPWRVTTIADDSAPSTPDLMARDFTADAPGRKLVSDINLHSHLGRISVPRDGH